MTPELRERLASVQHEIWAHWMRYLFYKCVKNEDGSATIPAPLVERWQRQMSTPYSALTDQERESDRHQADKVLAVIPAPIPDMVIDGYVNYVIASKAIRIEVMPFYAWLAAGDREPTP